MKPRIKLPNHLRDQQIFNKQQLSQSSTLGKLPVKQSRRTKKIVEKDKSHYQQFTIYQKNTPSISNEYSDNGRVSGNQTPKNFINTRKVKLVSQPKEKGKKKKWRELKDVITNQKVLVLKQTFIEKLRRNNPHSTAILHHFQDEFKIQNILDKNGFEFPEKYQTICGLFSLLNILISIFIFTIALVFPEIQDNIQIQIMEIIGALYFVFEMIVNLTTVRFSLGRKLETLRDISQDYKQQTLYLDLINILIIFCNIFSNYPTLAYFRIVTLLKFGDGLKKLEKLEVYFIENYYNEQYWHLLKVFMFNFCFAHILSIMLIAMVNLNPTENWMIAKGISNATWGQKYIWAYYWGTTIMLTIGFGDIVPVCYQQALCMILIQTFSCVLLSYNISCVGSLIANIRSQDVQKGKNLKIFKKLVEKHKIDEELSWKINNFIQQNANIKKLFNLQEEVQFVEKLPKTYRIDYLKQANRAVFQSLFFFNHLMEHTLFSLAQKIVMKITHPSEIILTNENYLNVLILKKGQIGYISKKNNRKYSKYITDKLSVVSDQSNPLLLHANFITSAKPIYLIKSLIYSALYQLQYTGLMQILRQKSLDFQLYCQIKDKDRYKLDQLQVVSCEYCKSKHTKFICPKLHFMPLPKHVLDRQIFNQKVNKSPRITTYCRFRDKTQSCLGRYLLNKQIYAKKEEEQKQSISIKKKIKKQNFILEQLKPLENIEENTYFKEESIYRMNHIENNFTKLQTKFAENATEIIKECMSKMYDSQNGQDTVWTLDADRMKNYKDYFRKDNPCNLQIKFDVSFRNYTIQQQSRSQSLKDALGYSTSRIPYHLDHVEQNYKTVGQIQKELNLGEDCEKL